jgi:hypothetical protein
MKNFIETADGLFSEKLLEFSKAVVSLKCYAECCQMKKPLQLVNQDLILFEIAASGGTTTEYEGISWVRYVADICEATADKLIDAGVASSHENFYRAFTRPLHERKISIPDMKEIFNAMAVVIKTMYADLQKELFPHTCRN